jgi:hypothetical protein
MLGKLWSLFSRSGQPNSTAPSPSLPNLASASTELIGPDVPVDPRATTAPNRNGAALPSPPQSASAPEPCLPSSSHRPKRKASAGVARLTAAAPSRHTVYSLEHECVRTDLRRWIERLPFTVRPTHVEFDRKRIEIVRGDGVTIAMVPPGATYNPWLFSDGYEYIEGAPCVSIHADVVRAGAVRSPDDKVTTYIECSGVTNECKAECGNLIRPCRLEHGHSQSVKGERMLCACGKVAVPGHKRLCDCSPNPCPESHFRCRWRLKVEYHGAHFADVRVFAGSENQAIHPADSEPAQKKYKMPESAMEEVDKGRIFHRKAPDGLKTGDSRRVLICDMFSLSAALSSERPPLVNDRKWQAKAKKAAKGDKKALPRLIARLSTKQIKHRVEYVDEVQMLDFLGCLKLPEDDFQAAELAAQSAFEDVLCCQRGDDSEGERTCVFGVASY